MVEGLAKEHICTPHGHRSSGDGQREGAEGEGTGQSWGEGRGEMRTYAIVSTIKIKKNEKLWISS